MTATETIGAAPRRREDARFVTGHGQYVDDLRLPGMAHAVLLRSPHAHAVLDRIDVTAARAAPGVLGVFSAADLAADGIGDLPPTVTANVATGAPLAFIPQPLLARGKVRHAGEAVALIVAETRAQALDASELINVDYTPLPAVITAAVACVPGAPEIAAGVAANTCLDWRLGDEAGADEIFARAAHAVTLRLDNHRIVTSPMEPRGGVGVFDPVTGRYTLHVSSQSLHVNRDTTARVLGVPPTAVRFLAPDVGGGFGAKNFAYPEMALLLWAARRTGRAVKWIATRSEVFLADHQARDHLSEASLALDSEGNFLALRVASVANLGAYMSGGAGGLQTFQYIHLPGTVYAIPCIDLHIRAVLTNIAPIGVTRGPGFAEANNIIERLIDAAARQCGFDPAELRRRNMVPPAAMPMTNAVGQMVDSGRFAETLDLALSRADIAGFPARRAASAARGMLRGLGFAYHIKATGGNPHENVELRFEADGTVSLISGTQTIGQGHETTFPQILAQKLGIPNHLIRYRAGDTDLIRAGGGHGSSRATYMGGTAVFRAADQVLVKARPIAAEMLQAAPLELGFADGRFHVIGTDRSVALLEVAARAREAGMRLDTYYAWTRDHMTFPNGTHVVEVEIDPETGRVFFARHTAVDDYGVLVNPMVATGQAHGAIAQGAGQALLEHAVYDPENGQMLAASFMDYALPRADDLPGFDLAFNPSSCTTNPLGVKGAGEAAAVALFPALRNAIADALASLGVTEFSGPATPLRIWEAIQAAKRR